MAYKPDPISVLTINCRGLNIPERRAHLLRDLRRKNIAIALLQETHFRADAMPKLQNTTYPKSNFCRHPTQRKAGVAILLASKLEFQEPDVMRDPQGRYLFLKGYLLNKTYTLASIYVPNKGQAPFLWNILSKLQLFAEGTLILGGDFNVPLDPILD
ncbi:Hypothetical predicted protein [Pelobates cultripes]|uniref:exodeoxyribonuclease III n=1 Tax=Pelobates cultripes TaxID=61616 RepID=A0AAD1RA16_PELCU|nr:Hypothetical predicted protein [Pelobates cultripes]